MGRTPKPPGAWLHIAEASDLSSAVRDTIMSAIAAFPLDRKTQTFNCAREELRELGNLRVAFVAIPSKQPLGATCIRFDFESRDCWQSPGLGHGAGHGEPCAPNCLDIPQVSSPVHLLQQAVVTWRNQTSSRAQECFVKALQMRYDVAAALPDQEMIQ